MDRATLDSIPEVPVARGAAVERGIAASVAYLGSAVARRSLAVDLYWPKWDSPWWHMLLLHELGEARRIPASAVTAMVDGLDRFPLHHFPIHPGDAPPGTDPHRDVLCHCALGSVLQVLAACEVDVAQAVPWAAPWFARYQMADGGFNCDEQAYLEAERTGACPSSMVGTVALFEAMRVIGRPRAELDRGAQFLIGRALTEGSATVHNAEERAAAPAWRALCFPRFYFYDVLRGLAALVAWAEATGQAVPRAAVEGVVDDLVARFPDGVVRIGRRAYDGRTTLLPTADRAPSERRPAATFALLDAASAIGEPSEPLTRQWAAARRGLIRLIDASRLPAA